MLIIFDWDGTLQNTIEKIVVCMQKSAHEYGIRAPADEAVRDVIGLSLATAMDELFDDRLDQTQRDTLQAIYSRIYNHEDTTPTPFFEGAIDLLNKLRSENYAIAVATGKRRRGLDRILAEHGLGHLFNATRCADETASKPDPLMLEELLKVLEVPRSQALMIGDSFYDMQMAVNAGVSGIGITHGVHGCERLIEGGAGRTIDSLTELQTLLLRC